MAAVSSSLGAKRSPDREVVEEETEQKRPALVDDSSVTQTSSEPTLVSAFQLRPSSLKAPSIKLQPTGAPNEGGPSIVSAGFSLTNQRSSITLGFSARQQLEQWSSLHGQPDGSSAAEGKRIFGSNFEKIVATEQGQGNAECSESEGTVGEGEGGSTESGPSQPPIEAVFGDDHLFKPQLVPTLPDFVHQTGEENDMVVVHIQAKLYMFDKETQSWIEKGRGVISLNDICQSSSEGIYQSRLVMRMAGSRRLLLNSNMWTEMSCEKVNAKSIRFTGQDIDSGSIRIFLIKGDTRNIGNLYSAMEKRVLAMRRACGKTSDEGSQSEDDSDCQRAAQSNASLGDEGTDCIDPAKDLSSKPPSSVAGEAGGTLTTSTQEAEGSEDSPKDDRQPD